ncbi:general secretion pathway protein GspB [Psychromonas antarctica]|uniref:general secretion pathway protein GspB n=1 Tax=Psychromonas antarctica TaxID=67573 RepID=UPI001EE95A33|nr:general secretion pathway protein GspB [Psychromonas antarctica]MCG6200682.1 general secretion pathway protein GspB [Psychromonas antarctica]
MSTILRALQKQKLGQCNTVSGFVEKAPSLKWKVALFAFLGVIISLLLILIYLLLKPVDESAVLAVAIVAEQGGNKASVTEQDKRIKKMTFDLQPLPILPADDIDLPTETVVQVTPVISASKVPINKKALPLLSVSGNKPEAQALSQQLIDDLDYSDTSADLQQRFEQALLMSKDDAKEVVEPAPKELNDGSDVHQMASEFQDKVPTISYDAHMYSSDAKERWIKINGEALQEGQFDSSGKIQVVEIQLNRTIFRLGRQSFSLASLTDWKGY